MSAIVDWSSPTWGDPATCVHIADWAADRHTEEASDE